MEALTTEEEYQTNGKKRIAHTSVQNAETVAKTRETLSIYKSKHRRIYIERRFENNKKGLQLIRKNLKAKQLKTLNQKSCNEHQPTTLKMATPQPNEVPILKEKLLHKISFEELEKKLEEIHSMESTPNHEHEYDSSIEEVQPPRKKTKTSSEVHKYPILSIPSSIRSSTESFYSAVNENCGDLPDLFMTKKFAKDNKAKDQSNIKISVPYSISEFAPIEDSVESDEDDSDKLVIDEVNNNIEKETNPPLAPISFEIKKDVNNKSVQVMKDLEENIKTEENFERPQSVNLSNIEYPITAIPTELIKQEDWRPFTVNPDLPQYIEYYDISSDDEDCEFIPNEPAVEIPEPTILCQSAPITKDVAPINENTASINEDAASTPEALAPIKENTASINEDTALTREVLATITLIEAPITQVEAPISKVETPIPEDLSPTNVLPSPPVVKTPPPIIDLPMCLSKTSEKERDIVLNVEHLTPMNHLTPPTTPFTSHQDDKPSTLNISLSSVSSVGWSGNDDEVAILDNEDINSVYDNISNSISNDSFFDSYNDPVIANNEPYSIPLSINLKISNDCQSPPVNWNYANRIPNSQYANNASQSHPPFQKEIHKSMLLKPFLNGTTKSLQYCNRMLKREALINYFKCMDDFCAFTTSKLDQFINHLGIHKSSKQNKSCPYCEFEVKSSGDGDLTRHMLNSHKSERQFQCGYCFHRAESSRDAIEHHNEHHVSCAQLIFEIVGRFEGKGKKIPLITDSKKSLI